MRIVTSALLVALVASPLSGARLPAATGGPQTAPSSVISAASPPSRAALDRVYVTSPTALLDLASAVPALGGTLRPARAGRTRGRLRRAWSIRSTIRSGWRGPTAGSTSSPNCSSGIREPCRTACDHRIRRERPGVRASFSGRVAAGSRFRAAARWATPSRAGAAGHAGHACDEVLRQSPTLQANAAQILVDVASRAVQYTAAARSFDNLGWYLGTSGVGLLYLPTGRRCPTGSPSAFPRCIRGRSRAGRTASGSAPIAPRWPMRR